MVFCFKTFCSRFGINLCVYYLLKPINILELSTAVEKATIQINPKKENERLKELLPKYSTALSTMRQASGAVAIIDVMS